MSFMPGGSDGKASTYNETDPGSIPGSGRSPGEGNGNPLQYSCLENPRDGGAWWAAVYGVAKSWTRLKGLSSSSKDAMRWKFIILRLKQNKWKRKTSRTNNRQLKENYRKKKKRKLDVHNVFLSRYRDITSLFLSQ